MTCLLVCAWIAIFSMMIHAVIVKDILWPQKEDREEGNWKIDPDEDKACDLRHCSSDGQHTGDGLSTRRAGRSTRSILSHMQRSDEVQPPKFKNEDSEGSPSAADKVVGEAVPETGPRRPEDMV